MEQNKTLLMITNVDWFFISHRLVIAQEAAKNGWKVYVATEDTGRAGEIKGDNIEFIDFKFSRSGTNPLSEFSTILKFRNLYKKLKPDVVHQITLKPVIYGSIAAKMVGIEKVVNAVSGLGYNFTSERAGLVQKIMTRMMKYGFDRDGITTIFQNSDDKTELERLGVIGKTNKIELIKGSGADLDVFKQSEFPSFDKIKILYPTRMLWDKGARELKEATDILKDKYSERVEFILAGMADSDNKAGVPEQYMNEWQDGEYVKWIGYQQNMVEVYSDSHIVVLPSYREGLPKTLIEACAIGRPIVTTDAVGCKECVDEGINGYKVTVYSVQELADALEKLINSKNDIIRMGQASREKAEREFDVKDVVSRHLRIYEG